MNYYEYILPDKWFVFELLIGFDRILLTSIVLAKVCAVIPATVLWLIFAPLFINNSTQSINPPQHAHNKGV